MHLKHFGDSYDFVKKSMLQWLGVFGPWVAHPMFTHEVSGDEADAFSRFLGVPLASTEVLGPKTDRRAYLAACEGSQSVFLDPDTGVRLRRRKGKRSPEFLFAQEIVEIASVRPQGLVLAFDQSLARGKEEEHVRKKLKHFGTVGLHGFAYVSHASFLLLGKSLELVDDARESVLQASGLPDRRIVAPAIKR